MYRRSILCWLCLSLPTATVIFAQKTNYDLVVQPVDTKARDFSEYLVQLAWLNSTGGIIALEEAKNAQSEAKNTKKEWMRDVQATFNLNEANLRPADSSNNVFFPRYNFGLNLNLFNILTQGEKNRISRREIVVAQEKVNRQMRETRAETLSRYASYKLAQRIYEARALVEQELNASFLLVQQLYKTDEKTLEDYTKASSAYFQAQEARMEAETEVQLTRIRLEEIIGLKWDQVQHPAKD